ncbi:hypothetical protein [Terrisporobacter petrolearius]|uniref:hypothetical protein n=1 Tax=Terrisporobacter petrolearius TaxID=1460447 RepID=UPI0022DFA58B|nr:hypothetical protein [Terrisporobacter petrolearius]
MLEIINEIVDLIDDAFDNKHLLNCNLVGLYNYIKYGNEDFDDDNKGIEFVYKIIFGVKAIENQFDIYKDKEEYLNAINSLPKEYNVELTNEVDLLKKYFIK